jgi:hypothetical protein
MSICELDHIVVTAPDLEIGAEWVRDLLGATPEPGGAHPAMGTHNRLLRLGDKAYLEVIAPNPAAPPPQRPRWFELDRVERDSPPRLAAWVARTPDIRSAADACSEPLGKVEPMSRGELEWLITIPQGGSLPLGGVAPMLIEWQTRVHPAARLRESGCALLELEGFHPEPERAVRLLRSIGLEGAVRVSALPAGSRPHLLARVRTPGGVRELGAR